MNNKGQSLVFFICLIPIIFILFVLIFDGAYMRYEKSKLDNIASLALTYMSENKEEEKVRDYILKNDSDIKIEELTNSRVYLTNKIKPVFGTFLNYDGYSLKSKYVGHYDNGVFVIDKEE